MAIMKTEATFQLEVDLDTSADPPVVISNRNPKVPAGDKIKWKKKSGAPDFTFSDFNPKSSPFENVDVSDNKIECDFNPPEGDPSDTQYAYTITVIYNDETYSSDESDVSTPTGGRAVIRN